MAATAFFARALDETEERPERVTADKAACYPAALRTLLPEGEHIAGKLIQQRIERDRPDLERPCTAMGSGNWKCWEAEIRSAGKRKSIVSHSDAARARG